MWKMYVLYLSVWLSIAGAVLAPPLDENLHEAMLSLYKASNDSGGMYTGIHATLTKEDFTSIEGVPQAKIPVTWAPSEPDNCKENKQCIIMLRNSTFADVVCNNTYPYICYRKEEMPLTSSRTVDKEYTLDARTGSYYKFHRIGRAWRRTQSTCLAEGGHLAIINSELERHVLKDIFAKNPSNVISATDNDVIALGFYDWGHNRVWYTVHGETLAETDFSTFSEGQPDNKDAHCGAMYRNGFLDDFWCDTKSSAFICEKEIDSLLTKCN